MFTITGIGAQEPATYATDINGIGLPVSRCSRCLESRATVPTPDVGMDKLLDLWATLYAWAAAQPTLVQIGLGIGLLAACYFLYVVIATTLTALYATFLK